MNNSVNDIVNSSCIFWDPLNNTQALFKYKWLKYESKIHYGTVHVLILLTNSVFHKENFVSELRRSFLKTVL